MGVGGQRHAYESPGIRPGVESRDRLWWLSVLWVHTPRRPPSAAEERVRTGDRNGPVCRWRNSACRSRTLWCYYPLQSQNPYRVGVSAVKPAILLVFCCFAAAWPSAVHAQQASSAPPAAPDTQKIGEKIFQQRCSVCHLPPAHSDKPYGLRLYKDMVDANEEGMREAILNGRPERMPGWKYTLQPEQIDSILEYLRTVERPGRPAS